MNKLISALVLSSSCFFATAQDGYFVKAGVGAGSANSSFSVLPGRVKDNHQSVLAEQGQLTIGRNFGKWQVETGIGYLQTGLSFVLGPGGTGGCVVGPNSNPVIASQKNSVKYTIVDPHMVVPLTVSRSLSTGKKFSVSPGAGIEALYNFKSKMAAAGLSDGSGMSMDYKTNDLAAAFLLKIDIQYNICSHMSVWVSPSYQKMFTSLTTNVPGDNMSRIYDRALLISAGIKYSLYCCQKTHGELNGAKN
jgi:hypothetical protein